MNKEYQIFNNVFESEQPNDPDANGLYNHEGNAFTDALLDHIEQKQLILQSQLITNFMNEKNYEFLKDQLKYTGFGEGLQSDLKEKIQKQTPEFQLQHAQPFGKDELSATLHFKKSNESEMYFFNRYDAAIKTEKQATTVQQTFYVGKENNITLKEAFNLLSGRAVNKDLVNKEGEKYNAWLQIDFKESESNGNFKMKQYHQNYGFNLEKALEKLPIKELTAEADKSALMQSLQKGNRQTVTYLQEGKEQRHFVEANPQFKTVTVYDGNMHKVNSEAQKEKEAQEQSGKQKRRADLKSDSDDPGGSEKPAPKSRRKKNVSVS